MSVDVIFLINEESLEKAIDDMIRRGVLYIVVLKLAHEKCRALTLFILHGNAQGKKWSIRSFSATKFENFFVCEIKSVGLIICGHFGGLLIIS